MKRKFLGFILLAFGLIAHAQNTAVSATVVDTDGTTWTNGSWNVQFVPNPSQPNVNAYTINGTPLSPSVLNQVGAINGSGVLAVTVYQNAPITPAGSSWKITVCPNAITKCGSYGFTAVGSSMDLSSALTPVIPAPRFNPVSGAYGYNDAEAILQLKPGSTYWNVLTSAQRCYSGSSWNNCYTGVTIPVTIATGGTGATTAAGALANLQGISSALTTPQTMAGPLSGPTISPSPLDYGAVGNGSTDDSAAFATAMASLSPGSTLSLNGHSYQLNTGVTVTAGVTIQGPGTLKLPSTASGVTLVTMSSAGASLKGVTLIGGSASSSLAVAISANDVTVEGNNISGFTLASVYLNSGLRFAINRNTICNNSNGGIYAAPSTSSVTGYGTFDQNIICNNTQNQGILIGGGAGDIVHFSVNNNVVYQNGAGTTLSGGGIWVWSPASDYVISGNTVYNNNGDGINVTAPHGVISGNQSDYAAGPTADPENSGIVVSGSTCHDVTVTGNKTRFNSGYGILVTSSAWHTVITGNISMNNSQYSAGVGAGIFLNSAAGYFTVAGNQVFDTQTIPTQNGITISSSPPYSTVVGNVASGNINDYYGSGLGGFSFQDNNVGAAYGVGPNGVASYAEVVSPILQPALSGSVNETINGVGSGGVVLNYGTGTGGTSFGDGAGHIVALVDSYGNYRNANGIVVPATATGSTGAGKVVLSTGTGFSGSCASTTTLTVVDGIITGCS